MCVFRVRSVCALLLSLSLSSVFMFCAKKSGQDAAPPAAAVASDNVLADARDGKKYKTVKIGEQVWMAENLNYEADEDGSRCYQDNADNCAKYGRLYEWKTAKTVCPAGWKLPDTADWNKLVSTAGGKETAAKKLKSKSGWNGDNNNGTDDYGFSALSGGSVELNGDGEGDFDDVGVVGSWWAATVLCDDCLEAYYLSIGNGGMYVSYSLKGAFFSVRCLKE